MRLSAPAAERKTAGRGAGKFAGNTIGGMQRAPDRSSVPAMPALKPVTMLAGVRDLVDLREMLSNTRPVASRAVMIAGLENLGHSVWSCQIVIGASAFG